MITGKACLHGRAFCVFGVIPPVGNFAKIHARGRGGPLGTVRKDLVPPLGLDAGTAGGRGARGNGRSAGCGPRALAARARSRGAGRGGRRGRHSRGGRPVGRGGRPSGGAAGPGAKTAGRRAKPTSGAQRAAWRARRRGAGKTGRQARAGRTARERGQISRGGRRRAREHGPPGAGPGRARRAGPGTRGAGRRRKAASKLSACVGFPPAGKSAGRAGAVFAYKEARFPARLICLISAVSARKPCAFHRLAFCAPPSD